MRESSFFRTPFESQIVHEIQTLLNSAGHPIYLYFAVVQRILSQKTSLLVRSKIVAVFNKALAVDHISFRHNWGKFLQHVKIPLSQKGKTFLEIFIAFFQSTQNLTHFQKKAQLHSLNSWEAIDFEKCGFLNARKLLFQNTLPQSKCSREVNTGKICLAGRSS